MFKLYLHASLFSQLNSQHSSSPLNHHPLNTQSLTLRSAPQCPSANLNVHKIPFLFFICSCIYYFVIGSVYFLVFSTVICCGWWRLWIEILFYFLLHSSCMMEWLNHCLHYFFYQLMHVCAVLLRFVCSYKCICVDLSFLCFYSMKGVVFTA